MSDITPLTPFMVLITPLGIAEAHFLWVRPSFEVPVNFGCFQRETKENWWWDNKVVRLCESISAGRSGNHSPIFLSDDLFDELRPHILRHKQSPFYKRAASGKRT